MHNCDMLYTVYKVYICHETQRCGFCVCLQFTEEEGFLYPTRAVHRSRLQHHALRIKRKMEMTRF
jgi:hypothetical protein